MADGSVSRKSDRESLLTNSQSGGAEKVADGFAGGSGLCFDRHGRLYISCQTGKLWAIPRPIIMIVFSGQRQFLLWGQ